MLSIQNLTKEYKNVIAVRNLSFNVQTGRIFGLLGPNGAGKTTTLRAILNIIKPTTGLISFEDSPITTEYFNTIGYLPEERGLYKRSKVIDTILYFAGLKNMKRQDAKAKAIEWLEKLGIESYRDKKIQELSKGNQQKIQFIIAIIHDPKLLILDEPFSGLDPINQQEIKELVLSFVNSGKMIILSTHQMETAEKLCSDILLLNRGEKVLAGTISQLKKQFSKNNVKIEFEGNANFLNDNKNIIHLDIYSNYAEIQLKDEIAPSNFLKEISNKLDITHFSIVEPTLNKIFIDAIQKN